MKMKIVVVVLMLVALIIGVFYMMGFRLRTGKDKMQTQSKVGGAPLATVRLLDASFNTIPRSTDIRAFNEIYSALGMTSDGFTRWEKENGYGSLGRNKEGQQLIPGFPIFSKVAWMYVDPVDLSPQEVEHLVQECAEAERRTDNAVAREELSRIRALAQEAIARSASLRFDHP